MRKIINEQMQVGEIDVSSIEIELFSRDEIPQLLRGLQHAYTNEAVRRKIFALLKKVVPVNVDIETGRNGMTLWSMLVLGTLRLNCNWDYDKLHEIANNHYTLRQMLGHGILDQNKRYPRQTLCDNLRWFTPEILDEINVIIVNEGLKQLGIAHDEALHGRCDSFVVETDVHFPIDINLLWDALRKTLLLGQQIAEDYGISGWRQTKHNLRNAKKHFRRVQRLREKDKDGYECKTATRQYIDLAEKIFDSALSSFVAERCNQDIVFAIRVDEVRYYTECGKKLVEQICRRSLQGGTIRHDEKMFSLFEPYTEWISKGKAGVPQELGLRVGIVECSNGFILHSRVMIKETDDQAAVPMIKETKRQFPQLKSCSFDKGYHSPQNQLDLAALLGFVVLPRKGKLDITEKEIESAKSFIEKRHQHAAVESAINAVENHGLDRCCDHGLDGFKRYVSMAVLARNIQLLGKILQQRLIEAEYDKAA